MDRQKAVKKFVLPLSGFSHNTTFLPVVISRDLVSNILLVLEVLLNHEEGKWFIMYPPLWNIFISHLFLISSSFSCSHLFLIFFSSFSCLNLSISSCVSLFSLFRFSCLSRKITLALTHLLSLSAFLYLLVLPATLRLFVL